MDTMITSRQERAFEIALELMDNRKVQVEDMLTHTFPISSLENSSDVNMNKGPTGR